MRILLINPPYIGWLNDIKVEPLGLLYIASYLRECGHEVRLYDAYMDEPIEVLVDHLSRWRPQLVGCSVYTVSEDFCFRMAELCKELDPDTTFVAGGPHATFAAARMLELCASLDMVVMHEAEETMASIATRIARGHRCHGLPGVAMRSRDGSLSASPRQAMQRSLDELPLPARDMLSDRYYEKYRAAGVITARGCAYKCDFCVSPAFFQGVRQRDIRLVADEIQQVINQRQIRHVRFYDDVFAYNANKLAQVKERIAPLGITYDCYVRVDLTTRRMLELLHESGCIQVRFGVETGHELARSRRKGNRTVSFEDHARMVDTCRELGIETLASYIFGFPDENNEDMLATIAFADRLNTDRVGFYKLTPYPGTVYWNMLDPQEIQLHDYTKFDNEVSVNRHLSSEQISDIVRLAYETYYRNREIPYDNPDTLRFLTSLPKLRY